MHSGLIVRLQTLAMQASSSPQCPGPHDHPTMHSACHETCQQLLPSQPPRANTQPATQPVCHTTSQPAKLPASLPRSQSATQPLTQAPRRPALKQPRVHEPTHLAFTHSYIGCIDFLIQRNKYTFTYEEYTPIDTQLLSDE